MSDPPLLSSIYPALPAKLQGISHITQSINQFLLPSTIDAAVYLDLQRVVKVFGATRKWTVGAMNGAAACGRLDIIKWLGETRSEGCSSVAFNKAATNKHLDVLHWLFQSHRSKCNGTEALVCAAGAGHLDVAKYLQTQGFRGNYAVVLEAAAANEQLQVLEYLVALTDDWEPLVGALAAASKNGLDKVTRVVLRGFRNADISALHSSRALEYAAAGGYVNVLDLLLEHFSTVGGFRTAECTTVALRKAMEAGHTVAALILSARCDMLAVDELRRAIEAEMRQFKLEYFF